MVWRKKDPEIMLVEARTAFEIGDYASAIEKSGKIPEVPAGEDTSSARLFAIAREAGELGEARKRAIDHIAALDLEKAVEELSVIVSRNRYDSPSILLLSVAGSLREALGMYLGGNIPEARAKIAAISKVPFAEQAVSAAIKKINEKMDLYEEAAKYEASHPDRAIASATKLYKRYPGDACASALKSRIEGRLNARNISIAGAVTAMASGNYPLAIDSIVRAMGGSSQVSNINKQAVEIVTRMLDSGHYNFAFQCASRLLALNPSMEADLRVLKNKARARELISELTPKYNVLALLQKTSYHREKRGEKKSDGRGLYFSDISWRRNIRGNLFTVRGIGQMTASGRFTAHDPLSDDYVNKGRSFVFATIENKSLVDGYFDVVSATSDSITFAVDNDEDMARVKKAFEAAKGKGFLRPMGDSLLMRKRAELQGIISRLEACASDGKDLTTGNRYLDVLMGLSRAKPPDTPLFAEKLFNENIPQDQSQLRAVTNALSNASDVTLIQGPPGTGKTTVISEIAMQYARAGKSVLIVSQGNAGIDNVGEGFIKRHVPFARLANTDLKISDAVKPNWLSRKETLRQFRDEYSRSHKGYIVLGTNDGFSNDRVAHHRDLGDFYDKFDVVIVEEAGRATLFDILLPAAAAKGKMIFVGDEKQLPAFGIKDEEIKYAKSEARLMLSEGLKPTEEFGGISAEKVFDGEILEDIKISPFEKAQGSKAYLDSHMLLINRRSHPFLVQIVNLFYKGMLRPRDHDFTEDHKEKPEPDTLRLIDVAGRDIESEDGDNNSYVNYAEVDKVVEEFHRFYNLRLPDGTFRYKAEDITIISPYKGQNFEIMLALRLRAVVDRIRDYGSRIQLDDEDRDILRMAVDGRRILSGDDRRFAEKFIDFPDAAQIGRFLSLVKYRIPSNGSRRFTEEEIKKIHVMINTIDSIQGHENKAVIVSMVRSNSYNDIGFLGTFDGLQRINVSLSRMQEKLVVIGDFSNTLTGVDRRYQNRRERQEAMRVFKELLDFAKKNNMYHRAEKRGGYSYLRVMPFVMAAGIASELLSGYLMPHIGPYLNVALQYLSGHGGEILAGAGVLLTAAIRPAPKVKSEELVAETTIPEKLPDLTVGQDNSPTVTAASDSNVTLAVPAVKVDRAEAKRALAGFTGTLASPFSEDIARRMSEACGIFSGVEGSGQSIILYADDILESAIMVDIEDTARRILSSSGMFRGGKIVIYSRDPLKGELLADELRKGAVGLSIEMIDSKTYGVQDAFTDEVKEARWLLSKARARGAVDVAAVIKSVPARDELYSQFQDLGRDNETPFVFVGIENGLYSLAGAISAAIKIKQDNGSKGWYIALPAVSTITSGEYDRYRRYLDILVAA